MEWKTSIEKPFALIKSGNGCKMVFLTKRNTKGELIGNSFKAHWKKVMNGDHRIYNSNRVVETKKIVKRWSCWPSVNGVKKAVKNSK